MREGSAILTDGFRQHPTNVGDVAMCGANTPCRAEPEGQVTVTTVYLDPDYAVDLFYWQHAAILLDRLEAQDIAATVFAEPVQVLRLGERRLMELVPWLDELAELSQAGNPSESFARMQALWFLIADAIRPFIKTVPVVEVLAQSGKARPRSLRHRRLTAPVRVEALTVRDALHSNIARRWRLDDLAEMVHLSSKQLARVFAAAYGKMPRAYLASLRVEAMARLLREENLTVAAAAHRVGWGAPRPARCSSDTSVCRRAGTASTDCRAALWEAVRTYLVTPVRHDPRTGTDHDHAERTTTGRGAASLRSARDRSRR